MLNRSTYRHIGTFVFYILYLQALVNGVPQRNKRAEALDDPSEATWPAVVKYDLQTDTSFSAAEITTIEGVLSQLEADTCLDFEPAVVEETVSMPDPRIKFHLDHYREICEATLGNKGGVMVNHIYLNHACLNKRGITYTVLKSIGIIPEHERFDRSSYIDVNTNGLVNSQKDDLETMVPLERMGMTSKSQYDYSSYLHFPPSKYAVNSSNPTLESTLDGMYTAIGQSVSLNFWDIKAINQYICPEKCEDAETKHSSCLHGGYLDPENSCSTCKCPFPWGGPICNEASGATAVNLTSDAFLISFGQATPGDRIAYYLQAPAGMWIGLEFIGSGLGLPCDPEGYDACPYGWVELRTNGIDSLGQRFCCEELPSEYFKSMGNNILVLFETSAENNVELSPRFEIRAWTIKHEQDPTKVTSDGRCGHYFQNMECTIHGESPCCNTIGYCGNTEQHCSDRDYRKEYLNQSVNACWTYEINVDVSQLEHLVGRYERLGYSYKGMPVWRHQYLTLYMFQEDQHLYISKEIGSLESPEAWTDDLESWFTTSAEMKEPSMSSKCVESGTKELSCVVDPQKREGCPGSFSGITDIQCEALNCCFDNTVKDVYFCFKDPYLVDYCDNIWLSTGMQGGTLTLKETPVFEKISVTNRYPVYSRNGTQENIYVDEESGSWKISLDGENVNFTATLDNAITPYDNRAKWLDMNNQSVPYLDISCFYGKEVPCLEVILNCGKTEFSGMMGIYALAPDLKHGRPQYTFTEGDASLKYIIDSDGSEYWIATADNFGTFSEGNVRIESPSFTLNNVQGIWQEYMNIDGTFSFSDDTDINVKCVTEEEKNGCNKVFIGGDNYFGNMAKRQSFGIYKKQNQIYNKRFTYQHESSLKYLYFYNNQWIVGNNVGDSAHDFRLLDAALKPDDICHPLDIYRTSIEEYVQIEGFDFKCYKRPVFEEDLCETLILSGIHASSNDENDLETARELNGVYSLESKRLNNRPVYSHPSPNNASFFYLMHYSPEATNTWLLSPELTDLWGYLRNRNFLVKVYDALTPWEVNSGFQYEADAEIKLECLVTTSTTTTVP
ncbi:unnamed protein product, partial [Owenia fusiformis]